MDQVCENIIFALKAYRIIFKSYCVDGNRRAGKHFDDCSLQTVKVHVDKRNDRLVGAGL